MIVAGMRLSGGIWVRTSALSLSVAAADAVNRRAACPLFEGDFKNLLLLRLGNCCKGLAADTETVPRNVRKRVFDRNRGSGRSVWSLKGFASRFARPKKAVVRFKDIADMAAGLRERKRENRDWENAAGFVSFIERAWERQRSARVLEWVRVTDLLSDIFEVGFLSLRSGAGLSQRRSLTWPDLTSFDDKLVGQLRAYAKPGFSKKKKKLVRTNI